MEERASWLALIRYEKGTRAACFLDALVIVFVFEIKPILDMESESVQRNCANRRFVHAMAVAFAIAKVTVTRTDDPDHCGAPQNRT